VKQTLQNSNRGGSRPAEELSPLARAGHVLIPNGRSPISAGTEKIAMELAQKSLLWKAPSSGPSSFGGAGEAVASGRCSWTAWRCCVGLLILGQRAAGCVAPNLQEA
jgi:hypothetical protein